MDAYEVTFKPSVEKDLRRLPREVVDRILKRIEALGENPRIRGVVKLSGAEALYRLRVGGYRVIYEIDSAARAVVIHYVRHRREAYRAR